MVTSCIRRGGVVARLSALLWLAAFTLTAPRAAAAEPDPQTAAAAEAAFRRGVEAFEHGDLATACPLFEAAVRLTGREGLGGLLMLGRCYDASGRFASAWATYNEVAARAQQAAQPDRVVEAEAAAASVEGRLHYLVIHLDQGVRELAGLRVQRNGVELKAELLDTPIPLDPGEAVIEVSATGRIDARKALLIPAGPGTSEVRFDALERVPPPPPPPPPPPRPAPPNPPPAEPRAGPWDGVRIGGLVVGIGGVAALGIGGALGLVARSQWSEPRDTAGCAEGPGGLVCDETTGIDDARALGNAATAVFAVGGALAAAGLTMVIVGGPDTQADAVSVEAGHGPGAFWLRGRF